MLLSQQLPLLKYHLRIDGTTIDDAKDVDLAIPMHNLIISSSNYSETMGSLQFYSKDEGTNFNANITNTNNFKSFEYKATLLGNKVAQSPRNQANGILKPAATADLLKYLSNFWRLITK